MTMVAFLIRVLALAAPVDVFTESRRQRNSFTGWKNSVGNGMPFLHDFKLLPYLGFNIDLQIVG